MKLSKILGLLTTTLFALGGVAAHATDYPDKPVRIVVPYGAGGASDLTARRLATELGKLWSRPVVVENKPGAGTVIGSDHVAKANPDGYTLLWTSNALVINPELQSNLPYDWRKDLAPITQVAMIPQVIVARPNLGANSFAELVELAKSKPGKVTFGSSGNGGPGHLAGALLNDVVGIDLLHVPYRGAGPAMNDLVGGQIDLMFNGLPATLPFIETGRLVPLAMASRQRSPRLPSLPSVAELGYPQYEASTWVGMFAPNKTPQDVVEKIQKDVSKVLANPETVNWLQEQGLTAVGSDPTAFQKSLEEEADRWKNVIRNGGIKADQS